MAPPPRPVSRYAVVSDKQWPGALMGVVAPVLFPALEIKVFTPHQRDEAVKWAAEFPEAPKTGAPAFRFLPTSRENVLAFEINQNGCPRVSVPPDFQGECPGLRDQRHDFGGGNARRHQGIRDIPGAPR
ncbi:MAG: STAS/SEC14 domain-containing protein [Nitrosospira sp.]